MRENIHTGNQLATMAAVANSYAHNVIASNEQADSIFDRFLAYRKQMALEQREEEEFKLNKELIQQKIRSLALADEGLKIQNKKGAKELDYFDEEKKLKENLVQSQMNYYNATAKHHDANSSSIYQAIKEKKDLEKMGSGSFFGQGGNEVKESSKNPSAVKFLNFTSSFKQSF